jgi:uncharacterized protein (TIGR02231 family)
MALTGMRPCHPKAGFPLETGGRMKIRSSVARMVGISVFCSGVSAMAESTPPSRITEVTVYADRARVQREAAVQLPAGVSVWRFAALPGWLDEESVRAALQPAAAGRIADIRIERDFLARPADEEVLRAEAAVLEMADVQRELEDERKALDAEARQVEEARIFAMEKLPREAALGPVDVSAYGDVVHFVGASARRISEARRIIDRRQRELAPELAVRTRRLEDLRRRGQLEQRSVVVTIEGKAVADATLTLSYLMPGATWQPMHELRAASVRPDTVALSSFAVVTQTTGEDWEGAMLSFSTQSPGEIVRIPELEAMRLGLPASAVRARRATGSSFSKAQHIFEAQNGWWFENANPKGDLDQYRHNIANRLQIEQEVSAVFEKIKARGTMAHFAGEGRPTVRSDGTAVRVPIGSAELAATPKIVAAPELSLNAIRTVEVVQAGAQPLLPGRVALFEQGAFMGFTDIDFVAEGETFALLLGVADPVKLSRVMDRKLSSIVRGSRTRVQVVFNVGVENLSAEPVRVKLQDRIPVSEDREIRVFGVDIKPEGRPDERGLLTWDVDLKPKEKRVYRIAYGIEYPQGITAVRQERGGADAVAPAANDVLFQIDALEKNF